MRLSDVYTNRVEETYDLPLPYKQVSPTRYVIPLDTENQILVITTGTQVNGYNCRSALFINPNNKDNPMGVTNYFNGPGAVRVISTVIDILEKTDFTILVCTADDIDIDVENQKVRLYQVVMKKMERMGKLGYSETLNVDEFDKPIIVGVRGAAVDQHTLIDTVKKFGVMKMAGQQ